jgi:hypothetical protein
MNDSVFIRPPGTSADIEIGIINILELDHLDLAFVRLHDHIDFSRSIHGGFAPHEAIRAAITSGIYVIMAGATSATFGQPLQIGQVIDNAFTYYCTSVNANFTGGVVNYDRNGGDSGGIVIRNVGLGINHVAGIHRGGLTVNSNLPPGHPYIGYALFSNIQIMGQLATFGFALH